MSSEKDGIELRMPAAGDGYAIHSLITNSPPLDPNSVYSYYLLSRHFRETCVVAVHKGEIRGFLSAYLVPNQPETLFVWQVVVSKILRGQGIASRMLIELLARPDLRSVNTVEATVNPDNTASRKLFSQLAAKQGTTMQQEMFLDASDFGTTGNHESEILLRVPVNTTN